MPDLVNIEGATGLPAAPSDGSVTTAKIASSAVTTAKIADANVTTGKIAAAAVTDDKLASKLVHYFTQTLDATAVANTTIFTPTASFLITGAFALLTVATGIGTGGTGSIGQTSAAFADIVAAVALTGLTDITTATALIILPTCIVGAGVPVVWRQSIASLLTTGTLKIVVAGVYL